MDPNGVLTTIFRYLPAIFLAVTGLMVGILFSGPLVDHVLPRIYGRKLSSRQSGAVRWASSLGMAFLCFMMAGQFGLGGAGPGQGDQVATNIEKQTKSTPKGTPEKIEETPVPVVKKSQPLSLKMRVLGPDLAKDYSGSKFAPDNLFWFAEIQVGADQSSGGKSDRQELLNWNSAQKRILDWKQGLSPGKISVIQFLYTTQDPDDSSPLVVEVTRWCRENGVNLERQTTAEGLP